MRAMAGTTTQGLDGPIARYAGTFHRVLGGGHQVASPLGAWLLLALCGPATAGGERETVTEALGIGTAAAAAAASNLLASPHPLVAAVAAVWNRPGAVDQTWLDGLPAAVERGDMPSQAELDAWARRGTSGLIERFPIVIDEAFYLLLASALATRVSWQCPFDTAPGAALGRSSPWASRLDRVLRSPLHPGHTAFIAATPEAGDVAVHIGEARGGLAVASVIASPGIQPGDVLAAAHQLAVAHVLGRPTGRRSLFDLPLGDAPLWSVSQERSAAGDRERCTAVLPAWSAGSEHDLSDPRLGFAAAAAALGHGDPWKARQTCTASYSRIGFEAAAVTAVGIRLAARMPSRGRLRTAELRFGHPYAVVAVTAGESPTAASGQPVRTPWHGLPVFSAWIEDPESAVE